MEPEQGLEERIGVQGEGAEDIPGGGNNAYKGRVAPTSILVWSGQGYFFLFFY